MKNSRWVNNLSPFGLASARQEGKKLDPSDFLRLKGEWPPEDFYTEAELTELKELGWERCDE